MLELVEPLYFSCYKSSILLQLDNVLIYQRENQEK